MPAERVSMRQIREVLRLRFASELPQRAIAKSLGLSQGAVSSYLSRARAALFGRPSTDNGRLTYRDGSGNAADRPKSLHIALHGAGTRRPFGEMPPMRP